MGCTKKFGSIVKSFIREVGKESQAEYFKCILYRDLMKK